MAPEQDAEPLLDERHETHVQFLDEDAEYVRPAGRRYLYAPISYEQAMAQQYPFWHPYAWLAFAREHQHLLDVLAPSERMRQLAQRVGRALKLLWPRHRLHQTVVLVLLLWIVISYTNWAVSEVLPGPQWDGGQFWSFQEKLRSDLMRGALAPRPGDGTIVANATWSHMYCFSTGEPLRFLDAVQCKAHTNFTLSGARGPYAMTSTDHLFVHVNPVLAQAQEWYPHTLPQLGDDVLQRTVARAPARVYVVKHRAEVSTDVLVNVVATYDKEAAPLLERGVVAKLHHGRSSEGIEILTAPRPPYGHFYDEEHDPVRFEIVVSVPAAQDMSGLTLDVREGAVEVFTASAFMNAFQLMEDVRTSRTPVSWSLFGGPAPAEAPAPSAAALAEMAALRGTEQFFASLMLHVQYGTIALGGAVRTSGAIVAKTLTGAVVASGRQASRHIYLWSYAGDVQLEPHTALFGRLVMHVESQHGEVVAYPDTEIHGSRSVARGATGITGGAMWHANFTMTLESQHGDVDARVAVAKPALEDVPYDDYLRTEHGRRVEARFASQQGAVNVTVVEHVAGVPLRVSATSAEGSVHLRLAPGFEGALRAQGQAPALVLGDLPRGRHVSAQAQDLAASPPWAAAQVVWDADARGPMPSVAPPMPPHLEPGKTPADYGAQALVDAPHGTAELVVA